MYWELQTLPEIAGEQVSSGVVSDMQNKQILADSCILLNQSTHLIITIQIYLFIYNENVIYKMLYDYYIKQLNTILTEILHIWEHQRPNTLLCFIE